jgi:hypothetical protein
LGDSSDCHFSFGNVAGCDGVIKLSDLLLRKVFRTPFNEFLIIFLATGDFKKRILILLNLILNPRKISID